MYVVLDLKLLYIRLLCFAFCGQVFRFDQSIAHVANSLVGPLKGETRPLLGCAGKQGKVISIAYALHRYPHLLYACTYVLGILLRDFVVSMAYSRASNPPSLVSSLTSFVGCFYWLLASLKFVHFWLSMCVLRVCFRGLPLRNTAFDTKNPRFIWQSRLSCFVPVVDPFSSDVIFSVCLV